MITSRTARTVLIVLALAASAVPTTACSERAPAPVVPVETAPAKPGVPPISEAKKAEVKAAFDAAAKIATQADALRREGEKIRSAQGQEAANDTFVKAHKLYRDALEMTEEWVEEDLGPFTKEQIDTQLRAYVNERAGWIKAQRSFGKLHD